MAGAELIMNNTRNFHFDARGQGTSKGASGFMMIELMISMVVLAVGLAGVLVLLISAMYTDKRSSHDTSATMVAEHVLEQITAQGQQATTPLQIVDCSPAPTNVRNIPTNRAPFGAGNSGAFGGYGATLTAAGVIDWTQAFAAVPNDPVSGFPYAIEYVACGVNGKQVSYDVRWNIIQTSANTRLTVIGARPIASRQVGGSKFVVPVNLRSMD
jgi:type II secretory pathway pseudopilin PulG